MFQKATSSIIQVARSPRWMETFAILLILLGGTMWWMLCTVRRFFEIKGCWIVVFICDSSGLHPIYEWHVDKCNQNGCDNIWKGNDYILLNMKAHYGNQNLTCGRLCCKVFGARICQAHITMTSWYRNLRRTSH